MSRGNLWDTVGYRGTQETLPPAVLYIHKCKAVCAPVIYLCIYQIKEVYIFQSYILKNIKLLMHTQTNVQWACSNEITFILFKHIHVHVHIVDSDPWMFVHYTNVCLNYICVFGNKTGIALFRFH